MSDPQKKPWSDGPNAPRIPYRLHSDERANFAGYLAASILYGFLIALFFKCMDALLNPFYRRGDRIRWGLVSYTVIVFLFATVQTAVGLRSQSICYIDNRKFPGVEGTTLPGPMGYLAYIYHEALGVIPNVMFFLSGWLADGLLLYRCYVLYSTNLWAIAFPSLMYLGSLAMGTTFIYQSAVAYVLQWSAVPYYSLSLSLNVLLTLMIVFRVILHARDARTAMGVTTVSKLYKAIITILIESCALYAASLLLVIGPWGARNPITNFFLAILPETQVTAALLIVLRIANKSALMSNTVVSGHVGSFELETRRKLPCGSDTLPCGDCMSSTNEHGIDSSEFVIGVKTAIDLHQEKVKT